MEIWMRITILPVISLFLFVGLSIGVDTWQFRNNSAPGTAEIISLRAEQNSTSSSDGPSRDFVTHYPTVRFVTDHGMEYEMETTQGLQPPIAKIGDRVPVRYSVNGNRVQVRLEYGAWRDWLLAGSITFFSLVFFICALFLTKRDVPKI